jgi:tetratricopeptide (TPR) repeat protein
MAIERKLVKDLGRALNLRHISEGITVLNKAESALANMPPTHPHATEVLLLVAQWVDVGYQNHDLLDSLLEKFPLDCRRKLALEDFLRVRMAEGFRALSAEDVSRAIDAFEFVLRAEREAPDEHLATLAHFWKGRAHRKKGEYETALHEIVAARELAQKNRESAMLTAVIQIHESWVLFQKGLRKEALRLLAHAEATLKNTDHYLALGNIESARGRIVRRSGEYLKALEHFDRAIAIYLSGDPDHRSLARTLVNSAYVKRLLALQLRKRIDAGARMPNRLLGDGEKGTGVNDATALRTRYQELCSEAMAQLRRARKIYALHGHSAGIGTVIVNSGSLHLDRGDIDRAASEALEAYRIGHEKNDHILMARARVLQAAAENAKVEEQLGEDVDTALHADHAKAFSDEALELARHTQNRRLLAGAYIARGTTAANEFFLDWDLARRCANEAANLMGAGENDHLADELAALKSRITQASGVNDTLRGWSEGVLGDKTFQQVTEEFAEIVIPKVWLREERKISRVAQSLSISPKKVRRILRNAGLLENLNRVHRQ